MNSLSYAFFAVIESFLRFIPIPARKGLHTIGSPDHHAPVFLTCNYHLTVLKVKRALRGKNAYLLVANSRGINVWCAGMGGHFRGHDVLSVLKTSGIEERVSHRRVILPQLAAASLERKDIEKRCGWQVVWGPVSAADIPRYMDRGFKKTPDMRQVHFSLSQRLEMAAAWAFTISFFVAVAALFFWPRALVPLLVMIWGFSFGVFVSFPLYKSWLTSKKRELVFRLFIVMVVLIALGAASLVIGRLSLRFFLRWGTTGLLFVAVLLLDLKGSTPLFKSSFHKDRLLRVSVNRASCRGAASCEDVCPRGCFCLDRELGKVRIVGANRCIQCGACIFQCPSDALSFKGNNGMTVTPSQIRSSTVGLHKRHLN
jgi:NAD-dependent dihydropyrimidine dehydrogenase PreA subunit